MGLRQYGQMELSLDFSIDCLVADPDYVLAG